MFYIFVVAAAPGYRGVQEFMEENKLLSTPFLPDELVHFMKENPNVDKKVTGDYIGDKRNPKVLEAFVK